jgi:hypothetical protein
MFPSGSLFRGLAQQMLGGLLIRSPQKDGM